METIDALEESMLWVKAQITAEEPGSEDALIRVADHILQCCLLLEDILSTNDFDSVRMCVSEIRDYFWEQKMLRLMQCRGRGRPKVAVSSEQMVFYLEHGFTVADIARIFTCSRRTIERRMKEAGLSVKGTYSCISDSELVSITQQIISRHPKVGEKMMDGMLKARSIKVQRQRISYRDSLFAADPNSHRSRLLGALHRRTYSVEGSNALWHIDGYHKLIRWRIVIHGGIDGYSRVVLYLRAATNNRSDTALQAFLCGVQEYGLPSRVRTDKGGENTGIAGL